jgi:alkylhydroperoxidase family enzyme
MPLARRVPRLTPLEPARWDERTRRLLGDTISPVAGLEGREAGGATRPLHILATIAHHPRLLEPFLAFAATLAAGGVLPRRASELLALRAAWNCRSPFEWGHHVIYARSAGLREEEIEAIASGPGAASWSAEDRALLEAADELHRDRDISDDTWARLRERWDEAQLLEIPFVVGQYTMLSMVANATDVPLEPGLPPLPKRGD